MVPGAESSPAERAEKPVWQLAFYAPLEEHKGIKLFCDAVEQLPKTVLARPGFEVYIIGEEAKIDQKLSLPWLKDRTAHWTWKTHILPSPTRHGVPLCSCHLRTDKGTTACIIHRHTWRTELFREMHKQSKTKEMRCTVSMRTLLCMRGLRKDGDQAAAHACRQRAMQAVSKEGMLVVFTSPLENVPYTLAEVAVAGIPMVTFDVGGATELIDLKLHEDLFCGLPTVSPRLCTPPDGSFTGVHRSATCSPLHALSCMHACMPCCPSTRVCASSWWRLDGRLDQHGMADVQVGNLVPCIRNALLKGYIAPPVLAPRIVEAKQLWLDWHHDFAVNQMPQVLREDEELAVKVAAMDNTTEIVALDTSETALQVLAPNRRL
jgi:hypothetical protein